MDELKKKRNILLNDKIENKTPSLMAPLEKRPIFNVLVRELVKHSF